MGDIKAANLDLESGKYNNHNGADDNTKNKAKYDKNHDKTHQRWHYIKSLAWLKPILALCMLYLISLAIVAAVFSRLPPLSSVTSASSSSSDSVGGAITTTTKELTLSLPKDFNDLRVARETLELYRKAHGWEVLQLLTVCYLFLQTFMIPGAIAINILAGSLYPFWYAFTFAAIVSTIGASCNYWLARLILRDIVRNLFPQKVAVFQGEIKKHHADLLNYMLFLRVTPLFPAWFISLASPLVGVPFRIFLIATAIGHQGVNFFSIKAAQALQSMNSVEDFWSIGNIALLMAAGVVALVPVMYTRWQAKTKATAES